MMRFEEILKHYREGKKIRCTKWLDNSFWQQGHGTSAVVYMSDLLSEWEVVEPKVTITREQFFDAVVAVSKQKFHNPITCTNDADFAQAIADRLGL